MFSVYVRDPHFGYFTKIIPIKCASATYKRIIWKYTVWICGGFKVPSPLGGFFVLELIEVMVLQDWWTKKKLSATKSSPLPLEIWFKPLL